MIKTENDIFYLSAGETCYVFGIENGAPVHIYFGKRVEREDDVRALGLGMNKIPELTVHMINADGKTEPVNFVFSGAHVQDGGDKTLVVELTDNRGLKAYMHYTPYPRGGIARRVVIENRGMEVKLCSVKQSVGCANDCKAIGADGCNNATEVGYLVVAASHGLSEQYGDAYGFLCAAADGSVKANGDCISCDIFDAVDVGGEWNAPELLCVYSDSGVGGMTRVFHDILRERSGEFSKHVPAVLFLPRQTADEAISSAKAAAAMGFVVVAVDGGEYSAPDIHAIAEACREQGLNIGLRVNRNNIHKDSALYYPMCKKSGGVYKYDCFDEHALALLKALRGIIAQNDIRYVTIDAPNKVSNVEAVRGMLMLKARLAEEFTGLRVDFGVKSDEMGKALTFCYPLECVRNIISPVPAENFKRRFDRATLGTLGYELPSDLPEGIKRAVRAQLLSYMDDASTVMHGDVYRQYDCTGTCRMAVSKEKSRAYAVCDCRGAMRVKLFGLDEHNLYHVREMNKTFSGAALVHCGILLDEAGTYVFHILQVADF